MNGRTLACCLALLLGLLPGAVRGQAPADPPKGPADIMNQANEGRQRAEVERAAETAEQAAQRAAESKPTAPAGQPAAPVEGADADGAKPAEPAAQPRHDVHQVLAEPTLPAGEPYIDAEPGSIVVDVIAPNGEPLRDAEIVLGVMASLGGRTEQRAKTGPKGRHVFAKLGTGTQQAYRVNVLYQGAKFSSTPFRLPDEIGFRVVVRLRETTGDRALMFQLLGQTGIELRDDRLHITQHARLANAGERVIVLPKEGLTVPLPEGFTAFQWQEQMSDQRGEELAGKGFRLRGSLPPGTVTLAWTFDVPRAGPSAKLAVAQPWRTYSYRVISEAPQGMTLRASEFPEAERVREPQRELLFTQVQRSPQEAELAPFTIRLDGIPGPGPGRWIAVALCLLAVGYGLFRARNAGDDASERLAALDARREQLIALAKATESEHERGEIGPQFRSERLQEIVTELALVLRDRETLESRRRPQPHAA